MYIKYHRRCHVISRFNSLLSSFCTYHNVYEVYDQRKMLSLLNQALDSLQLLKKVASIQLELYK